ncbi:MAG: hypothetical protein IPN70_04290 [Candidatus Moraniibacteriota bacterium]|nr:MAG: hypothetical protein IPN70_04290 [Candidatus Moranbacteria bacterium]
MKRRILFCILKYLAKIIIWRYRPVIIGITGSIGKTTTKDAVAYVLSDKYRIGATRKNFNNEIGLPLTVLGEKTTPGKTFVGWWGVFFRALLHIFYSQKYPEVLVLEMGIDRPGDMKYLLSIVRPTIGIVTGASSTHLEFFKTIEAIAWEKGLLIRSLSKNGTALLNTDNMYSWSMRKDTACRTILYGFSKKATIRAFNKALLFEGDQKGVTFKLEYKEKVIPIRLKNVIGIHHIGAILPAIAIGELLEMNLLEIAKKLESFIPPPGRFRLIKGKNNSFLIDDTYNASPASTRAGIISLGDFKKEEKILVLGDMLELGEEEKNLHSSLCEDILKIKPHKIILVGKRMKILFESLQCFDKEKDIFHWVETPYEVSALIVPFLHENSLIFIKGSQAMRMELVVEELMENPQDAKKLLCRQNKEWKEIPFLKP